MNIRDHLARARRDVLFAAAAFAFAAPSLIYPLGHDQAIHLYVGRAWLHGSLPYRDAFDYKPPGIFAIHALLVALFGDAEWPIRVADLVGMFALATGCWLLLTRRPRGSWGLVCVATAVAYYGFFSFWDTAQCELWTVAFIALSVASAQRARPWLAGLLMGCAFAMKTPALLFVPIVLAVGYRRSVGRRARNAAAFLVALSVVPVAIVAYFHARSGLPALGDALGGATYAYVLGARRVESASTLLRETVGLHRWFAPYAPLLLVALATSTAYAIIRRRTAALRRLAMPAGFAVAGFIAIAVQMKFYRYHWVLLLPALVLGCVELVSAIVARTSRAVGRVAVVALFAIYPLSGRPARWWWGACSDLAEVISGTEREIVVRRYAVPEMGYDRGECGAVADWLVTHTKPDEVVLVRGFVPEIYALARRHAAARFFWTLPLTDHTRRYKVDEWLALDHEEIVHSPPAYVVANGAVHDGIESAEYFVALGYARETTIGRRVILRRDTEVRKRIAQVKTVSPDR